MSFRRVELNPPPLSFSFSLFCWVVQKRKNSKLGKQEKKKIVQIIQENERTKELNEPFARESIASFPLVSFSLFLHPSFIPSTHLSLPSLFSPLLARSLNKHSSSTLFTPPLRQTVFISLRRHYFTHERIHLAHLASLAHLHSTQSQIQSNSHPSSSSVSVHSTTGAVLPSSIPEARIVARLTDWASSCEERDELEREREDRRKVEGEVMVRE